MVSVAALVVVVLALVMPSLADEFPYLPQANLTCANIVNYKCRTGSCSAAVCGVRDYWAIPNLKNIDSSCSCSCSPYGTCTYEGSQSVGDYLWWIFVVSNPQECCRKCKVFPQGTTAATFSFTPTCAWWQFRTLAGTTAGNAGNGGYCYLYLNNPTRSLTPSCTGQKDSTYTYSYSVPTSSKKTTVGAVCDSGNHDPHFVGHYGARFDFNGVPGETFCLVTDSNLHINMKLSGYHDSRLESAVKVVGGKGVRTWMRELGFMWTVQGVEHSLHLATREGPEVERGDGFLALIKADGVELPRMQEKDQLKLAGGLVFRFIEIEQEGPYTVEFYNLIIADVLDMDLRVRVANAKLRTEEDAQVHFSFGINKLETSAAVHGVLGQTYRMGREERNQEFASQLRSFATFSADSESGKGFLDGVTSDYTSSSILAPDCKYTTFNGRVTRVSAE
eukprot:TRINITY_DN32521_c0_g1_i1.p1 TRINITY_DN32521_c0_g1~~TRINITY_DN32521_c0_g1_i1.p1  ORF type:complete len:447 (+),score=41.47 TRINITY_DN32521_c0_g1_i1:208-1548(+)